MSARLFVVAVVALAHCVCSGGSPAATILIDDFEQAGRLWWEGPKVPVGDKPVSVARDPQRRSNVMRAKLRYTGGPIFISRALHAPVPMWKCQSVSFWYKLTTNKLSSERALICRLRTAPTAFSDYIVATRDTIKPGQWVKAHIDVRHRKRIVNIYRSFFDTAKWMTMRLDGDQGTTVDFEFFVDDIVVEMSEPQDLDYTPQITKKGRGRTTRALIIKNSAASFHNFEDIVRSLPFPTEQRVLKFRGLHFPIFGFPRSRAELMRSDLIVFVDVDPYVMPLEHIQWVSDFVASGGGLLFCGGPNTFGYSKDFKKPLADLLPVHAERENDLATVNRVPRIAAQHAVTAGIPTRLGNVGKAHLLRPKQGATVLLDIPPTAPPGWGFYTGGGPGGELVVSTDAHSGRYAAALTTREFYKDPKTGRPLWVGIAAIQGNADGYSGPAAYVARAGTRYNFSFWLKGQVPSVEVECIGWKSHQADAKDRHYIETTLAKLKPKPAWTRYQGSFTTQKDTCRFALAFRIHGNPGTVKLGQGILLDDVAIQEAESGKTVSANGGCEDVSSIPILAVGTFHRGRTAVLNAHAQLSHTLEGEFLTSPYYDDLMRQTLRWLLRAEPRIAIEQFTPPPAHMMAGERAAVRLGLKLGAAKEASVVCRCLRDGKVVDTERAFVAAGASPAAATINIQADQPTLATSTCELRFEVRDRRNRLQAVRTCPLTIHAPLDTEIRIRYSKLTVQPGGQLRFRVLATRWTKDGSVPAEGTLAAKARIIDFAGNVLAELAAKPMVKGDSPLPSADFAFAVPDLSKGDYRIEADVVLEGRLTSRGRKRFHVVDRLDLATLYPIMSMVWGGGGHEPDEALVRQSVDDLLAHGINVAAVGSARSFREWDEPSHNMAMRACTEAYAQTHDMALIYEYQSFTNLRSDRPVTPCVHSPEYRQALANHVKPYLEVGAVTPRLISIKVLDEPHAGPKTMDYCEHCRRVWKQRFGSEMPKAEEIRKDDAVTRRHFIEFVRDYVARGYRLGHELKTEAKAPWDLLLTYCSPAYGGSRDLVRSQEDLLWWSATADRIDFDVYPYFYPVSDKIVFLQAHFCMDLMRNVSQHLRKPWGFYVELDDRNYPLQINPVEASSECAMTAVAHGADYLNTFIYRTFATGCQARPKRWDHLGGTLRQIRAAGPLLNVAKMPRAKLAMLFPYAHWQLSATRYDPYYAHQLLLRAFGECDIVHEEVARRQGAFACKALALLQTDTLPDGVAKLITEFVSNGGLLLCDHVPKSNENGAACTLPAGLWPTPPAASEGQLAFARKPFGKGQTVLFSSKLDEAFAAAVKGDDLPTRAALRSVVRKALFARGLRPHALAADPEFEIGFRQAQDTVVLTAVNHGAKEADTTVTLYSPPFPIRYLADAHGRVHRLKKVEGGIQFKMSLPARCGLLLFGYPSRPARFGLAVHTPTVQRGGTLRYNVRATARGGAVCAPCKGQFLTPLRVTDPNGVERARYAPCGVTTDGVREVAVPIASNAPRGKWRIVLAAPFTRRERRATFQVE